MRINRVSRTEENNELNYKQNRRKQRTAQKMSATKEYND